MVYEGSCHCGQVAFEAEGEIDGALACYCSICRRKGSLRWVFLPSRCSTTMAARAKAA